MTAIRLHTRIPKLEPSEVAVARFLAEYRLRQQREDGVRDFLGHYDVEAHHLGIMGEMAFAKAAGVYFDFSSGTYKSRPDVGQYEVRTRSLDRKGAGLPVRVGDHDNRPFVLVQQMTHDFQFGVFGWIMGGDAKRNEWWHPAGANEKNGRWWVPRDALVPFQPG